MSVYRSRSEKKFLNSSHVSVVSTLKSTVSDKRILFPTTIHIITN